MSLVFYSKPDCPLCDEGLEVVRDFAREHGLDIRKVNIESAPELLAAHGQRIPVVVLDSRELGWGRLRREALETALRSAETPGKAAEQGD